MLRGRGSRFPCSAGISRGDMPLAAQASPGVRPLKMPLAEGFVLSIRADTAYARQAPEHDERDHRPHQHGRESGFANGHGTQVATSAGRLGNRIEMPNHPSSYAENNADV